MKTSCDGKKYPCECGKDHPILTLCKDSSDARRGWVSRKIEDLKPKVEPKPLVSPAREQDPKPSKLPPKVTVKRETKPRK